MKVKKLIYLSLISILMAAFTACTNDVSSDSPAPAKPEKTEKPPVENPPEKIVFQGTEYSEIPSDNPDFKGRYALFGDWPQTIKADDVEVDESVSVLMGGFTYYKGSDGAWYAKCRENARRTGNRPNPEYSNGNTIGIFEDKTEQYFKVEPIKWRILEPKSAGKKRILMSDRPLMADIIFYTKDLRQLNGKTIYPNNYKYSNMRAYLNGIPNQFVTDGGEATENDIDWTGKGFLQTAFTEVLQECINETEVDNSITSANPDNDEALDKGSNPYLCDKTYDKIFLLSMQEATTADYGFAKYNVNDKLRLLVPTDFARANNAFCDTAIPQNNRPSNKKASYAAYWFLRSPNYQNSDWVLDFDYEGGQMNSAVAKGDSTIVPALCLK